MATVHKWERYSVTTRSEYTAVAGATQRIDAYGMWVYYSTSYTINQSTGKFTLPAATVYQIKSEEAVNYCVGKYINNFNGSVSTTEIDRISKITKISMESGNLVATYIPYTSKLTTYTEKGSFVDTVESDAASAYPSDGVSGSYWYVYVGSESTSEPSVFTNVDGVLRKIVNLPVTVDGVLRELGSMYSVVGGVMRTIFAKAASSLLPSGYTLLDYIQSNGAQYIDSGFKPNQNTRVVCSFLTTANSTSIFGSQESWGSKSFSFGGNTASFGANQTTSLRLNDGKKHIVDFRNGAISVDGSVLLTWNATFQMNYNMFVLANNEKNTTIYYSTAKLYSCQIYDNGALVRDYVPCINSSGDYGLYDLANGAFYGNAGTGAFTGG